MRGVWGCDGTECADNAVGYANSNFWSDDMEQNEITLGDVIEAFYSELVQEYGDEDLAEVVAATLINEMILSGLRVDKDIAAA